MGTRYATPLFGLLLSSMLILSGCGQSASEAEGGQQGASQQKGATDRPGYSETKAMVLDILHSKDGMDTLKDTMSSPSFKRATAITTGDIQAAVEKTLQQGQNKSFLSEQMKDTNFAAAVVKASKSQMQEVQKLLMKDPEYQKDLLTVMKSPEFQQTQFELLKSPEYRKEVMQIMTEALQQPTFRLLFIESMKQAVKEAGGGQKEKVGQKQKGQQKGQGGDQESGGQDSQGGGEGDSGGGS